MQTNTLTSKLYVFAKLTTYTNAVVAYLLITKSHCLSQVYDVSVFGEKRWFQNSLKVELLGDASAVPLLRRGLEGPCSPKRMLVSPISVYSKHWFWNITERQDNRH